MGCCKLSCFSTKRPRRLASTIQKKEEVVEVHDEVKLPKGEVRPAN